jgi:hypothetical protein
VDDAVVLPVDSFSVISMLAESVMSYKQEFFWLLACITCNCKFTDGDCLHFGLSACLDLICGYHQLCW